MGSRILIAAGTGDYDHLAPALQRPGLAKVVEKVAELCTTKMGYTRVLQEISKDPTSDALVKKLDKWFASTIASGPIGFFFIIRVTVNWMATISFC
jgi:hypothetical protein